MAVSDGRRFSDWASALCSSSLSGVGPDTGSTSVLHHNDQLDEKDKAAGGRKTMGRPRSDLDCQKRLLVVETRNINNRAV